MQEAAETQFQERTRDDLQRHEARKTSQEVKLLLMLKLSAGKKQKSRKRRTVRSTVIFERPPKLFIS